MRYLCESAVIQRDECFHSHLWMCDSNLKTLLLTNAGRNAGQDKIAYAFAQ
jgi:hypothetical protein